MSPYIIIVSYFLPFGFMTGLVISLIVLGQQALKRAVSASS